MVLNTYLSNIPKTRADAYVLKILDITNQLITYTNAGSQKLIYVSLQGIYRASWFLIIHGIIYINTHFNAMNYEKNKSAEYTQTQ